jgi:hypothetical protein
MRSWYNGPIRDCISSCSYSLKERNALNFQICSLYRSECGALRKIQMRMEKAKTRFLMAVPAYRTKYHEHNEDKLKFWSPE